MPHLHEIVASIHKLDGLVARAEGRLAKDPQNWDIAALLHTNVKLLARRKQEFDAYVKSLRGEPVSYSVHSSSIAPTPGLRDICSAFASFETAVLLTAQSKLLDQPVVKRKLEPPVEAASLRYGYLESSGPNQLAFVACTRGEQQREMSFMAELEPGDPKRLQVVPDGILLEAAQDVFQIVNITPRERNKLTDFARKNGHAPLLEISRWCSIHSDANLDAESRWGDLDPSKLRATRHQMETVVWMLNEISDDIRFDVFELTGVFYSVNSRTRRFAFESDEGEVVAGHFDPAVVNHSKPMKVPRRYRVTLSKATRENEALGESVVRYTIISLTEA